MPVTPSTLPTDDQCNVPRLGSCTVPSPLVQKDGMLTQQDDMLRSDRERVLIAGTIDTLASAQGAAEPLARPPSFEAAGPRARLFHDPASLTCGIVTCGGLCPGLNDVIRSVVMTAHHRYGVRRVLGFRYGYNGLSSDPYAEPMELSPERVRDIHQRGGTLLGTSRGPQDIADMADTLERHGIGVLFAVGGDGTLRGASALRAELARRQCSISVVGIPKTIDNDIDFMERSFGFTTAVEAAQASLEAAHMEARGAWNGVGLVQLMGRHSGFIAAHASLANGDVNFCLIPEAPFDLEGPRGLLQALEQRLERRHHAVVVVAEGAGQHWMQKVDGTQQDPSGNSKLLPIGQFLKQRIQQHFRQRGMPMTLKLIDPSYTIRSLRAGALDSAFCLLLGQHAVHAAMAGRTDMVVGYWNQHFVHLPIPLAVARRKQVDPSGALWQQVLSATGQERLG